MTKDRLQIGIVGACGRGGSFRDAFEASGRARIRAVCDTDTARLPEAAARLGAEESYADFAELLDRSALDAVVIGTPMPYHAPQATAALQQGLHVLSEVPAGVSVSECRALVAAARASSGIYMMAENYLYMKPNMLVAELVRRGLFGTTYYAEGEYIHELKGLNEETPWRRRWQTGMAGVTYPTHSLGPALAWMPGDRVRDVCCAGSGHHYTDPRGNAYENDDSTVMLCRMCSGSLVKIRVDMLSDRPHAMTNYSLQGTDGAYESARAPGEQDRIWLRSLDPTPNRWRPLAELEAEFLPEPWRGADARAAGAGHGGGDFFQIGDFLDAALGLKPPRVDVDRAMDMTLPGLVSRQSILEGGRWIAVPDSREWLGPESPPKPQLRMTWPADRDPGAPSLPPGYRLRAFRDGDVDAYIGLMASAGFAGWTPERIAQTRRGILPGGFFLIEHEPTGAPVATAMARHAPTDEFPEGGEMGWVAGSPAHAGKGLGRAVCTAATALLRARGYETIYLFTDDWRLPALSVYLRMGYEPVIRDDEAARRWAEVHRQLRLR